MRHTYRFTHETLVNYSSFTFLIDVADKDFNLLQVYLVKRVIIKFLSTAKHVVRQDLSNKFKEFCRCSKCL